jgi:hypothetical protein
MAAGLLDGWLATFRTRDVFEDLSRRARRRRLDEGRLAVAVRALSFVQVYLGALPGGRLRHLDA